MTGTIGLEGAAPAPGGVVRVRVEDVSRLDAAAITVAESTIPIDSAIRPGERLPFSIDVPTTDETAEYNVSVHVDGNGSGRVEPGDLISTAAHPVLTRGHSDVVAIQVHAVE